MKHIMAVYDVDAVYALRLADVINQRELAPFEVMAFTSLERLKYYSHENPMDLLLISQSISREEIEEIDVRHVLFLSDGEILQSELSYPCIYKFQSSDSLVREVVTYYCENEEGPFPMKKLSRAFVAGIYSPIGRCLKTSFAITMGQLLSKDSRVLYVTLEDYSILSVLTNTEYQTDLSDLMYFYSQGNYNVLRLNSVVHSLDGLDYVPPARFAEDLQQMGSRKMAGMLNKIAEESDYETLILDIGNYGREVLPILELCSVIYMPIKEDGVSLAKLEEFDRYLDAADCSNIRDRIRQMKLPYHNSFGERENYLQQLLWGELGDYVRQLLKGGIRHEGV